MEAMYPTGKPIPIDTEPLFFADSGEYATGLSTIKCKVRRASDGYVLDWGALGGPTFIDKAGPFLQLLQPLSEFDDATFPGEYRYVLDLSVVTNVADYDGYCITAVEDDAQPQVANLPQVGGARVVPALDDATMARKALYNDQLLDPGDTDNATLLDDDKVTPLARWNIKGPAPGKLAIAINPQAPAIRERTL